jgi:predicted DNA-binding transcriptional regulator AlpA
MCTPAELGDLVGLSAKSVANRLSAIRSGRLPADALPPAQRLGGRTLFRLEDVRAWIDRHLEPDADREVAS